METITINVVPVNDAPVLSNAATPVLSAVNEDAAAPSGAVGTLVSALVDLNPPAGGLDNVSDADTSPVTGIALTGTSGSGSWFYSVNGGANWFAVGSVSDSSARLLAADANTRLYFRPNADFSGTVTNAITFRAWDQSTGTNGQSGVDASISGGSTAFSTASDTANITVNGVNDAPAVSAVSVNASGQISFSIADADSTSFTLVNSPAGVAAAFGSPTTLGLGSNALAAPTEQTLPLGVSTLQISDGAGGTADVIRIYLGTSGNNTADAGGSTPVAMFGFGNNDNLTGGTAADFFFGGAGTDTVNLSNGDFAAGELIDGGSGTNSIVLSDATTVNFSTGTIANVETLTGSGSADNVTMSAAQWAAFSTINLAGDSGGDDTLNIQVTGSTNISGGNAVSISGVEDLNVNGTANADNLSLTGAQLDAIITSETTINLNGGTNTITLTSTSNELATLDDDQLLNVAIVAAGSSANTKLNVSEQSEAFVLIGNSGNDTLAGGSGDDTLTGNGGSDQFRLRTNGGSETITDFVDGTDRIGLFDSGSTGSGSVNFGNTAGSTVGNALNASDLTTRGSISAIDSANDDNQVIVITSAQTQDQIENDVGSGSGTPDNLYVVVFNSDTGRGEIWFDTNWETSGGRSLVATLDNITTLAGVAALTAADFVVYSSATDPLVLDLGQQGISLSTVETGVSFDINADGAVDQVAWTTGQDGMLALDVNGNGTIDNGAEIFSPYFAGGEHASSLAALASLDSNGDGVMDANDAQFANLTVWQDVNHDGVSQANELSDLAANGITSIDLQATPTDSTIDGQQVLSQGSFTTANGGAGTFVEVAFDTALGANDNNAAAGARTTFLTDAHATESISDYSAARGDVIDVSGLLEAHFGENSQMSDFVNVIENGSDVTIQIDQNGPASGAHFVDVAVLHGYGSSGSDIVRIAFENVEQQIAV